MSKILKDLNLQQRLAVEHGPTPLLLLAGAGSGKTKVLTHRAAYFIEKGFAKADSILLLTFTNKAAGEMKDRMANLIPGKSQVAAGTFHSISSKFLRADGFNIGIPPDFVIYDTDDQDGLIKMILKELDLTTKEFKPANVISFIDKAKNSNQKPSEMKRFVRGFWEDMACQIYERYEKKKTEYKALDFNDLLGKTIDLLLEFPLVLEKYQNRYQSIFVDEYQDTNQIQYLFTRLLAKKHLNITAVGDASQSIYGWRGADYKNLMAFSTDFPGATVLNLEQNYRSTDIILKAANSVISKNTSHPVLELFTNKRSTTLITVFQASSELSEAEYVSRSIEFLHLNKFINYKDIAVLYRTNAQSRTIEESFLKHTIPYVLIGGLRFYERAEIKDLVALLRFLKNTNDAVSDDRVEKALGKRKKLTFENFISTYDLGSKTTLEVITDVLDNTQYLSRFNKTEEEDARRLENIQELQSVAATHTKLDDFLENVSLVQQEYSQQEKNKKDETRSGVRLMTFHASKGLEFEVVFLVGFEEGILPHANSMLSEASIEEERRLAYVGITRAKEYLYLTHATQRLFFGKSSLNEPSRFLLDIPKALIQFEEDNLIRDFRPKKTDGDDFVYDSDIY